MARAGVKVRARTRGGDLKGLLSRWLRIHMVLRSYMLAHAVLETAELAAVDEPILVEIQGVKHASPLLGSA